MSRKRPPKSKQVDEAVPSEVLAEGSGPNEVVDANPQSLVAAAQELVDKRRERKAKRTKDADGGEDAADPTAEGAEGSDAGAEDGDSADLEAADADIATEGDAELEAAAGDDAGDAEAASALSDAEPATEKSRAKGKSKRKRKNARAAADADADLDAGDALGEAGFEAPPPKDSDTTNEQLAELIATAEGDAIAAVEDAVMRAEAEVELGDAELEDEEAEDDLGAALPTSAATMDPAQLKHLVEALVFAADKPMTLQRLRQLTRVGEVKRLEDALAEITADYANRGIALQVVSGGYQFRTNTTYSTWVQQLIAGRPVRLSRAQLETLAIVAYRQPITRPEIDEIRGVDSSATLRLLLDRSLIRSLGKKEEVGRPMLYGTTREFLDFFSLNDLRELPTLREYSELTAESRKVMSDEFGIDEPDYGSPGGPTDFADDIAGEAGHLLTEGDGDAASVEADSRDELARWAREPDADAAADADADADADAAAEGADEALSAAAPAPSAPGNVIRDGIEYDRWGQPLGPVDDDEDIASDASASAPSDESLDATSAADHAGDETGDDIVTADADADADADAEADELSVSAGASFEERANLDRTGTDDAPSAQADLTSDGEPPSDDLEARSDEPEPSPVHTDDDEASDDPSSSDEPTND